MYNPKEDVKLMEAVSDYLSENELSLPDDADFVCGIDYVAIRIGNVTILEVGLPPVSQYPVNETEHTNKYLRQMKAVAV